MTSSRPSRSSARTNGFSPGCRANAVGLGVRGGFTLVEVVIAIVLMVILIAAMAPIARNARSDVLRTVSLKNLVVLAEAQACYAADWSNRQWSIAPRDFGVANGNCLTYVTTISCPPQALLGRETDGTLWGYFWGSIGHCEEYPYPGLCTGNQNVYRPIAFSGPDAGFGAFRIPNMKGFQEYIGEKYYEKEWFSELDSVTWGIAEPYFALPDQFTTVNNTIAYSAYCLSPAAMYHPSILRRPSQGGFKSPDGGVALSYSAPSLTQCAYPDLKSRMVEHSWLVDPPSPTNPAWQGEVPWYFNQGIASRPGTLFFDGSVQEMTMKQAVSDDEAMLRSTNGVDGLWSRDTPFGADGYFGAQAYDDTRNSFHILTTDGILGRDFLKRGRGRIME
jgi:prepilin-type N-terminal cleavage/methylation domain-containing protein